MNATISFSLDPKTDADIVRWLDSLPSGRKSAAIREAIRAGWNASGPGEVERKLDAILARLHRGVVVSGNSKPASEPARAADALDRLGI
jgi:hypothetical protein